MSTVNPKFEALNSRQISNCKFQFYKQGLFINKISLEFGALDLATPYTLRATVHAERDTA